jgi:RNA ligase
VKLHTLFDSALLDAMLEQGHVRTQRHPVLPLVIYNYTERAAYEQVWNAVTLACRGLVVHAETRDVVARPFGKFFNYGQPGAPVAELSGDVMVTDKLDGSLGILYPTPDGHAIATRGSFDSEQARHATALWRQRYAGRFTPPAGSTLLFEIVYPANRIVCDYGDLDDLILLGAVDVASGQSRSAGVAAQVGWPGPVAETFAYASFADALAAPPRANAEGLVVHFLDTDHRVKLKQDDYVALHRIVTGLSARTVWQHMVDGKPMADLVAPLPDEFHPWVQAVADGIAASVERDIETITRLYGEIVAALPDGWSRRDFAAVASTHELRWALFRMLDERDCGAELLRRARPEAYLTPSGRTYTEDTA